MNCPVLKILLFFSLIITLTACNLLDFWGPQYDTFEPERPFYVTKADGSSEVYTIDATLMAYTDHSLIYVEEGNDMSTETAQDIADEFEDRIYDVVRDNFAYEEDVDDNERIILLLVDIVDGYSGSGGYVSGYFNPNDEFYSTYSNRADMIYLDVDPATAGSDSFFETAAHEFQHLVNFAETYLRGGGETQDTWLNEGLSSAAEYLYSGTYNADRLDRYNFDPEGSIAEGNNFYIWNGDEGDVLADYSTVYLFFQWMRIHASNGSAIFKEILNHSDRDYRAVLESMNSRVYSSTVFWEDILRDWYLSIYFNDPTGIYGFKNEFSLISHLKTGSDSTILLNSGEGVFDSISGTFTDTTATDDDSSYAGISDTEGLDLEGPEYTGEVLLAWNGSADLSGGDISIPISASIVESVSSRSRSSLSFSKTSAYVPPERYPVGVRFTHPHSGKLSRDDD
jgi:hypothetical protein